MKPVFKITAIALFVLCIILSLFVMHDWNYTYDQQGHYTSLDGIMHRESEDERNFFLLVLSVPLLIVTAVLGFKKSPARIQVK